MVSFRCGEDRGSHIVSIDVGVEYHQAMDGVDMGSSKGWHTVPNRHGHGSVGKGSLLVYKKG